MAPFPVCIFGQALAPGLQPLSRWDGQSWVQGYVVDGYLGRFCLGQDGELYLSEVTGTLNKRALLRRAVQVQRGHMPEVETIIDADIDLPVDLEGFSSVIYQPNIVWSEHQAALLGIGYYSYQSAGGNLTVETVFSASPSGVLSFSGGYPSWPSGLVNAAVEFEDGSFAALYWGEPF